MGAKITIPLSRGTRAALRALKKELHLKTDEETLRALIEDYERRTNRP